MRCRKRFFHRVDDAAPSKRRPWNGVPMRGFGAWPVRALRQCGRRRRVRRSQLLLNPAAICPISAVGHSLQTSLAAEAQQCSLDAELPMTDAAFDWGDDAPPRHQRHDAGLAHPAVIDYHPQCDSWRGCRGGLALAVPISHGEQTPLTVAADAQDDHERDRPRLLIKPDAHTMSSSLIGRHITSAPRHR